MKRATVPAAAARSELGPCGWLEVWASAAAMIDDAISERVCRVASSISLKDVAWVSGSELDSLGRTHGRQFAMSVHADSFDDTGRESRARDSSSLS